MKFLNHSNKTHSNKTCLGTGLLLICILLGAGLAKLSAAPQDAHQAAQKDELQRTYQIHEYLEVAKSGPARGENIYFYACFLCHNQYAKGGPPLKDLFKHADMYTGNPANDENVTAQIKNGSARMPGFGHNLTDADIKDVLSYLKSETCCYEADEPPANPQYRAAIQKWPVQSGLTGGANGLVRDSSGKGLEGIKVQLIAPNGVRTTVFTNEDGRYQFPSMQTGAYTLRIATPAPYQPFRRDSVQVNGSGAMDEIVLTRLPEAGGPGGLAGAIPAIPEVEAQMSGAELLWNLPGTAQEKTAFAKTCGIGCHSYQQVFRSRFTENDWRKLARRMLNYHGNDLVVARKDDATENPETDMVIKWLAKVRGPESHDLPYRMFPRPSGASTRVVITEFEMPRRLLTIHDVSEDSKGNIWYTSHRSPNIGILDPRTGIVKEYKVPFLPGAMPGTHHVAVDKNDIGWYSEDWGRALVRLDPTTGEFRRMMIESADPINYPGFSNFALAPDGSIWHGHLHKDISKFDPETGKVVASFPLAKTPNPYDNIVSADGRFYAAGSPPGNGYSNALFMDIRTGKMMELNSGEMVHSAARGGFDPDDNAWFGGRDGPLVEIVNEIDKGKGVHIRNYWPPTPYFPYTEFYSVAPDKNGEIWAPQLQGRGVLRFNPKTGAWRSYDNAEPSAFARNTWIDNKTTPVTIWYPDYDTGMIVRIQPLD